MVVGGLNERRGVETSGGGLNKVVGGPNERRPPNGCWWSKRVVGGQNTQYDVE
jgi:hypothetical protein